MTHKEKQALLKLVVDYNKEGREMLKWNRRNRTHAGHSETPEGLGDEGWSKLFYNDGAADAFFSAGVELTKRVEELYGKSRRGIKKTV